MSRGPEDPGAWFWWPGCSERRGRLPVLPGRGARSASAFGPSPRGSAQLSHCGGGSFHARDFSLVHCPDGGAFERHRDTHTAVLRQPVLGSWEMWAPCLLSVCWTPWNGILRHSPRLGLGRDRGRTPLSTAPSPVTSVVRVRRAHAHPAGQAPLRLSHRLILVVLVSPGSARACVSGLGDSRTPRSVLSLSLA